MGADGAGANIRLAVLEWPGVEAHPHRFGGTEFRVGAREIGHIHGDHLLDIPFPKKVRDRVIAEERAEPHHILPDTGWVSFYLRQEADVEQAVALLRESYELALAQKVRRNQDSSPPDGESAPS